MIISLYSSLCPHTQPTETSLYRDSLFPKGSHFEDAVTLMCRSCPSTVTFMAHIGELASEVQCEEDANQ